MAEQGRKGSYGNTPVMKEGEQFVIKFGVPGRDVRRLCSWRHPSKLGFTTEARDHYGECELERCFCEPERRPGPIPPELYR